MVISPIGKISTYAHFHVYRGKWEGKIYWFVKGDFGTDGPYTTKRAAVESGHEWIKEN